jgi:hypothetical protein
MPIGNLADPTVKLCAAADARTIGADAEINEKPL